MSKLTQELVEEHFIIVRALKKVKNLGVSSQEGRDILLNAKSGLLAHLQKEDDRLYPALNKAAETNPDLKRTLDFFAKDMDLISKTALAFFDKYSTSDSSDEFTDDFKVLFSTLSTRIGKEELILYKRYDALNLKDDNPA